MASKGILTLMAVGTLGVVAVVSHGAGSAEPTGAPSDPLAVYSNEADHLWNRLHAALFVRKGPDGRDYGHDRLEPLLWRESTYLLQGEAAGKAVGVLEEFVRERGEKLIDDPIKRAVLQRDLWLISNWLSGTPVTPARSRLETLLDQVIRRVALRPEQIADLPNNYARAVASKAYADHFDPEKPQCAYLPPDLFEPSSSWVCVGAANGPTAPFHLDDRGTNPFGNSVFLIFLKLPGGRGKTLDFLTSLAALDELLVPNCDETSQDVAPYVPHQEFPAWPKGTEVALVRRALLIDTNLHVAASPLTEGVQIRVVTTDMPCLTKEIWENAARRRSPEEWQSSFEFQLRRRELFGAANGGLRDVSEDRDFKTGFNSHTWDEFDRTSRSGSFPEASMPFVSNRASCATCHNLPGAYSFNSVPGFAFGGVLSRVKDGSLQRPPGATTVIAVQQQAIRWNQGRKSWTTFLSRSGE